MHEPQHQRLNRVLIGSNATRIFERRVGWTGYAIWVLRSICAETEIELVLFCNYVDKQPNFDHFSPAEEFDEGVAAQSTPKEQPPRKLSGTKSRIDLKL